MIKELKIKDFDPVNSMETLERCESSREKNEENRRERRQNKGNNYSQVIWKIKITILASNMWRKTLVAVKVMRAFKIRRKKVSPSQEETKSRNQRLWRRLGFKIRIFNVFAKKIERKEDMQWKMAKLKRKLGG